MIKNVIFDIGFVLVDFNFDEFIQKKFDDKICHEISKTMWGSRYWRELDMGIKPMEEVLEGFVQEVKGYENQMREVIRDFGQCMSLRDFVIDWMKELKAKGIKIYFLSNWSEFLSNANPSVLDFMEYVDGGVFSCDVHMVKPNTEIYDYICKKYSLNPEECIFIDDLDANVEAACNYGIHGMVYEGFELSYKKMNDIIEELS